MTEGERIEIYNALMDWRDELSHITIPSQSKRIHVLSQAIAFIRGTVACWQPTKETTTKVIDSHPVAFPCKCSSCAFARGFSDFRFCPQCGARMQRK